MSFGSCTYCSLDAGHEGKKKLDHGSDCDRYQDLPEIEFGADFNVWQGFV